MTVLYGYTVGNGRMKKLTLFYKKIFFLLLIALSTFSLAGAADFYWENPAVITDTDSRFPLTLTSSDGKATYLFWQEVDVSARQIYLSVRAYRGLKDYTENRRFAGPYSYSGDEVPDIYTTAILKKGTVGVAVMTGLSNLSVFTSSDGCKSFTESKIPALSPSMALSAMPHKLLSKMVTSLPMTFCGPRILCLRIYRWIFVMKMNGYWSSINLQVSWYIPRPKKAVAQ